MTQNSAEVLKEGLHHCQHINDIHSKGRIKNTDGVEEMTQVDFPKSLSTKRLGRGVNRDKDGRRNSTRRKKKTQKSITYENDDGKIS